MRKTRPVKASRLMDVGTIEREMGIYKVEMDQLPLTTALNEYLLAYNPYKQRKEHRFATGEWLRSLDDTIYQLMDVLSTGLMQNRHDPQFRVQINELYNITWYLLAAERGKKKIKVDSHEFARYLGDIVDFVGQEIARRQGWVLIEGEMKLFGSERPKVVVTPKGAKECPDLLEAQ